MLYDIHNIFANSHCLDGSRSILKPACLAKHQWKNTWSVSSECIDLFELGNCWTAFTWLLKLFQISNHWLSCQYERLHAPHVIQMNQLQLVWWDLKFWRTFQLAFGLSMESMITNFWANTSVASRSSRKKNLEAWKRVWTSERFSFQKWVRMSMMLQTEVWNRLTIF